MNARSNWKRVSGRERLIFSVAGLVCGAFVLQSVVGQAVTSRFAGPTSSQPLALTANGAFLVVANPDNNTASFFEVRSDRNRKIAEVPVQTEPWGAAFLPDGSKAYIANTVSGTVTVIPANLANGAIRRPTTHIVVGAEPYGLALTPNGKKLYVTNTRSNDVSVIDTATDTVIKTITGVGLEPRGVAVSNDGDEDDDDELIYVTQFFSLPIAGKLDGADDSKAGHVTVISGTTNAVIKDVTINPISDTGFKASGNALLKQPSVPIPVGPPFDFVTGAYPNQLNNLAIKGSFVFLPNTGASPNGPVRFDVNTQSLLSVMNRVDNSDTGNTINLHKAVADQTVTPKLFVTQPWAIAFEHGSQEGYVASAASNILVKVTTDISTGQTTVQQDPLELARVLQIPTGKNPRGLIINAADTRAYVMNYVSRDVTVIDLTGPKETVLTTMKSANLPVAGTLADKIHVGKELYNTSVGEFENPQGGAAIRGRMSNNGWGSCSSCHPFGLSDNVVWIFPAGPRRTIPQHADFDPEDLTRSQMRMLNWSANRDEQEDFENNIRGVSGGGGLIVKADGVTPEDAANVPEFTPLANGGRNQLKIRSVGAWDGLKAYIQFGIRAPISPISKTDPDVIAGEALFRSANCQQCHGGGSWSSSRVRFTPPPDPSQVVAGQLAGELRNVGTFDQAVANEVRQNGAPPLGAAGFVPPSIMSLFAFPQTFLHNGAATTLEQVMDNVTHRAAGTSGVDTLANPADRQKLVQFLLSIDASTPPIPIP